MHRLQAREMNSGHMSVARYALSEIVERVLITELPKAEHMTAEATGNKSLDPGGRPEGWNSPASGTNPFASVCL